MENKIKDKLITWAKRIATWLYNKSDVVVDVRPIHRDIHLNSSRAISIYLDSIDRPCNPSGVDWQQFSLDFVKQRPSNSTTRHEGGGTSLNELE